MICLTPITLFRKTSKSATTRYRSDVVPCGKCPSCLYRRQAGWIFRLEKEQQTSSSAAFLTLTYSEENLPWSEQGYPTLHKKHHQLFIKRLRKTITTNFEESQPIKYYSCGEYGEKTHRPHYHSIMFNLPDEYIQHPELLTKDWRLGNTLVAEANSQTIAYTTKYINKTLYTSGQDDLDDRQKEFSMMSKGIGMDYLTPQMIQYYKKQKTPYLIVENGEKRTMPRIYKNKIYTEHEKLQLNRKTERFHKENPTFTSEKNRHDVVKQKFKKSKMDNNLERQKL